MHTKEIEAYMKLLEKSDVTELEVQDGDHRIRLVRGHNHMSSPVVVSHMPQTATAGTTESAEAKEPVESGSVVTSPFVGTFYRSPSPEAPTFVDIGSSVSVGQTLCIVEAMKLMNEIESEFSGVIKKIFIENGQPVEYGDKLFLIE